MSGIEPMSTAVSVIGLGPMGAACARAFVADGHPVTVWNRTPERAAPFAEAGARVAATPAEAIAASPLTVVIVANDEAVRELLAADGVDAALADRTVANLTSGVPESAAALEEQIGARGGRYLDGRIGSYPRGIATPNSCIVYAGDRATFDAWAPLLRTLGPDLRHVSDDVRAANVLALAMYNAFHHATIVAFFEAGAMAERLGVPLRECVPLARQTLTIAFDAIARGAEQCERGDHAVVEAAIDTHADAVARARRTLLASGAAHAIFDAVADYLERARGAGLGELELSALYELLRDDDDTTARKRP